MGAGVTIFHGINSILNETEIHISPIIFAILATSFIIETFTFLSALKELRAHNKGASFLELLEDGDPTTIAVLYEDGVAVLGVAIAFFSILLSTLTGNYYWDAIGSIVIGTLLGTIAIILIRKNRLYLIGKNIPDEIEERVIEIMKSDPAIEKVLDFKSSVLDVKHYQIKCEVEFNGTALMKELSENGLIKKEYSLICQDYAEFIRFLADYVDRVPRLIGSRIDKIEKKIQKEIPEIKHIDIEIN